MKRSLVVWSFVFSKVHLDASKGFLSGKRGDQVYVFLISLWQLLIWLVSEFRSRGVRQGANTGMQKRLTVVLTMLWRQSWRLAYGSPSYFGCGNNRIC